MTALLSLCSGSSFSCGRWSDVLPPAVSLIVQKELAKIWSAGQVHWPLYMTCQRFQSNCLASRKYFTNHIAHTMRLCILWHRVSLVMSFFSVKTAGPSWKWWQYASALAASISNTMAPSHSHVSHRFLPHLFATLLAFTTDKACDTQRRIEHLRDVLQKSYILLSSGAGADLWEYHGLPNKQISLPPILNILLK